MYYMWIARSLLGQRQHDQNGGQRDQNGRRVPAKFNGFCATNDKDKCECCSVSFGRHSNAICIQCAGNVRVFFSHVWSGLISIDRAAQFDELVDQLAEACRPANELVLFERHLWIVALRIGHIGRDGLRVRAHFVARPADAVQPRKVVFVLASSFRCRCGKRTDSDWCLRP